MHQENIIPETESKQLFFEPFFYHDPQSPGYFSLLQKRKERVHQDSYPLRLITDVLPRVDKRFDTYLSQNGFNKPNRRVVNLWRINLNYLDLDTYNKPNLENLLPEEVTYLILKYCQDNSIPIPSLILFSGRGLQIKWILERPLPRQVLPRWNALQRHLAKRFEPFGADAASLDASRVLRLEQTVNTRSGQVVRILYPSGLARPVEYDFDLLANEILPYTREQIGELQAARAEMRQARAERAVKVNSTKWKFTRESLHWGRIEDMRTLARLRGWDHGNPDGQRFPFIFLGAISLSWITPPTIEYPARLYTELEALSRQFAPHWTPAKIREHVPAVYKRFKAESEEAQKNPERYRYTNQKAQDMLQVTPGEESEMKIIISDGEKRRRNLALKERQRRERGDLTRAEYEAKRHFEVEEKQKQALELRKKGFSFREIGSQMAMTAMGVYKLLDRCKLVVPLE